MIIVIKVKMTAMLMNKISNNNNLSEEKTWLNS